MQDFLKKKAIWWQQPHLPEGRIVIMAPTTLPYETGDCCHPYLADENQGTDRMRISAAALNEKNPHCSGLTNLPFRHASPLKKLLVLKGALTVAKGCGRQTKHLAIPKPLQTRGNSTSSSEACNFSDIEDEALWFKQIIREEKWKLKVKWNVVWEKKTHTHSF